MRKSKITKRLSAGLLAALLTIGTLASHGVTFAAAEEATEVMQETTTAETQESAEDVPVPEDGTEDVVLTYQAEDTVLVEDGTVTSVLAPDSYIHCSNPWNGGSNIPIWKNSSEYTEAPQIIYAWFDVNGQQDAKSLFCIDYGAAAKTGDRYATQQDYGTKLNREQRSAISYVLGCATVTQAPKHNGGFDTTADRGAFNLYMSTQLMIWYYINAFYTPGMNEGIGWDGVVATCNAGWGNLEECQRIKDIVDKVKVIPSFAANIVENATVPVYEMAYNPVTGSYEVVLQDTNGVLDRYSWTNSGTITYTRCNADGTANENGSYLRVESAAPIQEGSSSGTCASSYVPQVGDITYITNETTHTGSRDQDLLKCDSAKNGDPILAAFSVYTAGTATIKITKSNEDADTTSGSSDFRGAEYSVYAEKDCVWNAEKNVWEVNSNATAVRTIVIGRQDDADLPETSDGTHLNTGIVTGLPVGIYILKETKAPLNGRYEISDRTYGVDCTEINQEAEAVSYQTVQVSDKAVTGEIKVKKSSGDITINSSSMSLKGTTYAIYATRTIKYQGQRYVAGDRLPVDLVINQSHKLADGTTEYYGEVTDLPISIYEIQESATTYDGKASEGPIGYEIDSQRYTIDLTGESDFAFTFEHEDTPLTSNLSIHKVDALENEVTGDATVEGAVYGVYANQAVRYNGIHYSTGACIARLTTDADGKAGMDGLPYGVYTVKEIAPSQGYELDPTEYTVDLTNSDNPNEAVPAQTLEVHEQPVLTDYKITKVKGGNDFGVNNQPFEGCEFALYLISDLDSEKLEYDEDSNLDFSDYDFSDVIPYRTAVSDENGEAVFEDCYYGAYVVVETKVADDDYIAVEPYTIELPVANVEGGYLEEVNAELVDAYIPHRAEIEKVDENGNRITGATLAVVSADGDKPATNADGSYQLLQVAKLEDGEPVVDTDGNYIMVDATWESDQSLHTIDYIPEGNYFLVELEAAAGYTIADPIAFTISDEQKLITVSNKQFRQGDLITMVDADIAGRIRIYKTGDQVVSAAGYSSVYGTFKRLMFEQKPLAGVTFELYKADGTFVATIITGEDGYAVSGILPWGDYYLIETETPAGLVNTGEKIAVELTCPEDYHEAIYYEEVEVTNVVGDTEINVYKQGEILNVENGTYSFGTKPLEGVIFGVYANEDLHDYQGNVIIKKDECIGFIKTGADGKAALKDALVEGNYYYKEVQTLGGYILDESKREFTLVLGNEELNTMDVNKENPLVNQLYKTKLRIVKSDSANKEVLLSGVEFELYNEKNELMGTYVTDADGQIIVDALPYGTYYFKETKAADGYIIDSSKQKFEANAAEQTLEVTNAKTPVTGDNVIPLWIVACVLGLSGGCFYFLRRSAKKK